MSGSRTWGTSVEPAPPTDDPAAILTATQAKVEEQDERLDRISKSINVQKNMASEMNNELKYQNRLLDDIDEHVDSSGRKVRQGVVQARGVEQRAKQKGLLGCVVALFVIIIIIFILMFALPKV